MANSFQFYCNTRIIFGAGTAGNISEILSQEKWTKIGIVVDANLSNEPAVKKLLLGFEKNVGKLIIGKSVSSEPTYDSLEEIRPVFDNQKLDVIIGIGGGSALDTAKAMAVLTSNRQPAIFYRGFNKMTEPVLPIIAIPTTAGTGSEITPNASFVDTKEKKKMGINGEAVRPRYAVLDPELTISCPKNATISAGIDSIVHAVEAYVAQKSNPMSRIFSREGFKRVSSCLAQAVKEPGNIDYRSEVMFGALLSGIALMNSGTGPAAAMSYPLSVHFKVPHGIGGGIFLPHVIKYNIEKGFSDYVGMLDGPINANASVFMRRIDKLWNELSVPDNLAQFGFSRKDIPMFVKEVMELKGALDQNPVPFYEKEIESILRKLGGKNE